MDGITVFVPATTANLGPGFDCLGLALDLWNRTTFQMEGRGIRVSVTGEGTSRLPGGASNLIAKAFLRACQAAGQPAPQGLRINCENAIPLGSGLGSSAAAALAGLTGANALLGLGLSDAEILRFANEIEGHVDNAAAALHGGLVIIAAGAEGFIVQPVPIQPLRAVVVLPDFHLPTKKARAALPRRVFMKDAVASIGHTALVVEALRAGDRKLLMQAMIDRLHQPVRLALIPGAEAALNFCWERGVPAALSGAGPSVIAFPVAGEQEVADGMRAVFSAAGLSTRSWAFGVSLGGLEVKFGSTVNE